MSLDEAKVAGPGAPRHSGGMRLECPACAAAYDVPDSLLAPGRAVRCVRCAQSWVPVPPRLEAPPRRLALPPLRPSGPPAAPGLAGVAVAWAASLAAVAAGGAALWHWRAEIAAAWPPAARLLALLPQG
ncbi:hypothetical protein CR162_05625 [Pseudoroseomonas rhizosphaerae]|uniref:Zinc finger/thioredoxin putative domain-containing protein n=2 Tax=Teichococcus rhizosphaerae TaxID=1335062 RepID=A0A2C7AFC1_9PROT|nr:hypothetical protein CR162_05625 [Pseudoroseomonas rhizosphaerae]